MPDPSVEALCEEMIQAMTEPIDPDQPASACFQRTMAASFWLRATKNDMVDRIVLSRQPETDAEWKWFKEALPTRLKPGGRIEVLS